MKLESVSTSGSAKRQRKENTGEEASLFLERLEPITKPKKIRLGIHKFMHAESEISRKARKVATASVLLSNGCGGRGCFRGCGRCRGHGQGRGRGRRCGCGHYQNLPETSTVTLRYLTSSNRASHAL